MAQCRPSAYTTPRNNRWPVSLAVLSINQSATDRRAVSVHAVSRSIRHTILLLSPCSLLSPLRSLLLCWSVITTVVSLVTIISRLCVMSPQSQPDRQTDQQSGPVLRDYTGSGAAVTPSLTISDPTQWNTEVMRWHIPDIWHRSLYKSPKVLGPRPFSR